MPDDVKEEVTEQDGEVSEELEEESDFDGAFDEASGGESEEEPPETDDTDTEDEDEAEAEETKDDEPEDEEPEEEEELSDADKRGKEILDQAEKDQEESDRIQAEAEKEKAKETETLPTKITPELVTDLSKIIPLGDLPEILTLEDGSEVDLKGMFEDFPGMQAAIGLVVQRLMKGLVNQGIIATGKSIEGIQGQLSNTDYDLHVYKSLPGMDVDTVLESKEFKDWSDKAADRTKALLNTGNPSDFVLYMKEYDKSLKVDKAKSNVEDKDKKARESKANKDKLFKTTVKGKGRAQGGTGSSANFEADEDEFDAAFEEAARVA